MTITELAENLERLGYPVAYSHFFAPTPPPFICYLVIDSDTFTADDKVTDEFINVDIELYTIEKALAIEKKIKDMLKTNELPWAYDEIFIKEEGVFKCTFSIQIHIGE